MGRTPIWLLEEWDRQQRSDHKQSEKRTIVRLPCCGSSIEVEAEHIGEEQFIVCPNRFCGKRHLLTWGMKPTLQTELPR